MRLLQCGIPLFTTVLLACGSTVTEAPSEGAPHGAVTGPETIVGEVSALTEVVGGQTSQRFDLNLQVMSEPSSACAGATSTVGSCCYFKPVARPATQVTGSGNPVKESSAGTVTLTDVTSNAHIDSFDYESGAYAHAPANYEGQVWRPGDSLSVNAAGDQIGAFTLSAPTLVPPSVQVSSPVVRAHDVTVTWQPDANAETLIFSIADTAGATVACAVPDAAGTLTIPSSLLTTLEPSARAQALAQRQAVRYAQTPTGRVAFRTFGWAPSEVSVD